MREEHIPPYTQHTIHFFPPDFAGGGGGKENKRERKNVNTAVFPGSDLKKCHLSFPHPPSCSCLMRWRFHTKNHLLGGGVAEHGWVSERRDTFRSQGSVRKKIKEKIESENASPYSGGHRHCYCDPQKPKKKKIDLFWRYPPRKKSDSWQKPSRCAGQRSDQVYLVTFTQVRTHPGTHPLTSAPCAGFVDCSITRLEGVIGDRYLRNYFSF